MIRNGDVGAQMRRQTMRRPVRLRSWVGFAALAFGLAALAPAPAQTAKDKAKEKDFTRERVTIATADGVDLDATFYRPQGTNAGNNSPCVMLRSEERRVGKEDSR